MKVDRNIDAGTNMLPQRPEALDNLADEFLAFDVLGSTANVPALTAWL